MCLHCYYPLLPVNSRLVCLWSAMAAQGQMQQSNYLTEVNTSRATLPQNCQITKYHAQC